MSLSTNAKAPEKVEILGEEELTHIGPEPEGSIQTSCNAQCWNKTVRDQTPLVSFHFLHLSVQCENCLVNKYLKGGNRDL